jgi:hypothetical protein
MDNVQLNLAGKSPLLVRATPNRDGIGAMALQDRPTVVDPDETPQV